MPWEVDDECGMFWGADKWAFFWPITRSRNRRLTPQAGRHGQI